MIVARARFHVLFGGDWEVTQDMSVADVLERAADLIEPAGAWTQMDWGNRHDCFCMLGAMAFAAGADPDSPWSGHLAAEAREPLADVIGVKVVDLPDWNDEPDRTQSEVVAMLRKAAALADRLSA